MVLVSECQADYLRVGGENRLQHGPRLVEMLAAGEVQILAVARHVVSANNNTK